jgi:hypothetical protein
MICFVVEACKGGLHWLLEQGLLSCKALSISSCWYTEYLSQSSIITTQKMHGMQGQYSRLPMPSFDVHCSMFTP